MTRRIKRVAALLRHELSSILLSEVDDPRVGFVTVTGVTMSPDLREAEVTLSILGEPAKQRTALRGLTSARNRIRGVLGKRTELRCVPELTFRLDNAVKKSIEMSKLLADLAHERDDDASAAGMDDASATKDG